MSTLNASNIFTESSSALLAVAKIDPGIKLPKNPKVLKEMNLNRYNSSMTKGDTLDPRPPYMRLNKYTSEGYIRGTMYIMFRRRSVKGEITFFNKEEEQVNRLSEATYMVTRRSCSYRKSFKPEDNIHHRPDDIIKVYHIQDNDRFVSRLLNYARVISRFVYNYSSRVRACY